jgi:hypothetical protein
MRSAFCIVAVIIVILTPALTAYPRAAIGFDRAQHIPAPRLISPVNSEVDLTGKDTLKFMWSAHEGSRIKRKYYDFRLYSGIGTTEISLILKKQVDAGTWQTELDANIFETGKFYTWSLRQVYDVEGKSNRNTWTFKAVRSGPAAARPAAAT